MTRVTLDQFRDQKVTGQGHKMTINGTTNEIIELNIDLQQLTYIVL